MAPAKQVAVAAKSYWPKGSLKPEKQQAIWMCTHGKLITCRQLIWKRHATAESLTGEEGEEGDEGEEGEKGEDRMRIGWGWDEGEDRMWVRRVMRMLRMMRMNEWIWGCPHSQTNPHWTSKTRGKNQPSWGYHPLWPPAAYPLVNQPGCDGMVLNNWDEPV